MGIGLLRGNKYHFNQYSHISWTENCTMLSRLFVLLLMSSLLSDGQADNFPQFQLELLSSSPATPEDSCDYIHDEEWKCGDSCLGVWEHCSCGSSGTISYVNRVHCCTPPDSKCYKAQSDSSMVVCSEGLTQPFSIPCNTTVQWPAKDATIHTKKVCSLVQMSTTGVQTCVFQRRTCARASAGVTQMLRFVDQS